MWKSSMHACIYLNKAGQGAEEPVFAVHRLPDSVRLLTGLNLIFLRCTFGTIKHELNAGQLRFLGLYAPPGGIILVVTLKRLWFLLSKGFLFHTVPRLTTVYVLFFFIIN